MAELLLLLMNSRSQRADNTFLSPFSMIQQATDKFTKGTQKPTFMFPCTQQPASIAACLAWDVLVLTPLLAAVAALSVALSRRLTLCAKPPAVP